MLLGSIKKTIIQIKWGHQQTYTKKKNEKKKKLVIS